MLCLPREAVSTSFVDLQSQGEGGGKFARVEVKDPYALGAGSACFARSAFPACFACSACVNIYLDPAVLKNFVKKQIKQKKARFVNEARSGCVNSGFVSGSLQALTR